MQNTTSRSFLLTVIFMTSLMLLSCTDEQDQDQQTDQTEQQEQDLKISPQLSGNERSVDMSQFSRTEEDISYTESDSESDRQTLDIIYPEDVTDSYQPDETDPHPTIVAFHGGAWARGDKQAESVAPILQATNQGYAVVSVNYRLSDDVNWPEPLHDAKAAIRFIRANAEEYNLDTEQLVAWGVSSGGHIAQMLAATNNQPDYEDPALGHEDASSAIHGVVSWYGISEISNLTDTGLPFASKIMGYDVQQNEEKSRSASPLYLVSADYPPILLVHGSDDQIVPQEQSIAMQDTVNQTTGEERARLITVEGGTHGNLVDPMGMISRSLDFIDILLYSGDNPYRSTEMGEIELEE